MTGAQRTGLASRRFLLRASAAQAAGLAVVVLIAWLATWAPAPLVSTPADARLGQQYDDGHAGELTALSVTPGHVLVGTERGAVSALDKQTGLFSEFTSETTDGALPIDAVAQIEPWVANGKVFYRSRRGALAESSLGLRSWRTLYSLARCPMTSGDIDVVAPIARRWLAAGSRTRGVCIYDSDAKAWQHFDEGTGLSSSVVSDLLPIDDPASARFLVATAKGIDLLSKPPGSRSWTIDHTVSDRGVRSFEPSLGAQPAAKAQDDLAFITTAGGVGHRAAGGDWKNLIGDTGYRASSPPEVTVAAVDEAASLLIVGTRRQGWNVYDTANHQWLNPAFSEEAIEDIVQFDGRWWIGGSSGLHEFVPGTRAAQTTLPGAISRIVTDGRTLFALSADGAVRAFSAGSRQAETIVAAERAAISAGRVVGCVVRAGELWLALADARILVYNARTHALRRADAGLFDANAPRRLTQLLRSGQQLWAVAADAAGSQRLFRYGGTVWTPAPLTSGPVVTASATSHGVFVQAASRRFFFASNDGSAATPLFAAGGPDADAAERALVAAAPGHLYIAPVDGPDANTLFAYDVAHHTWSQVAVPSRSRLAALHLADRALYGITTRGGLLRMAPAPGEWRVLVGDTPLEPEDARAPEMVTAARTGSTIWVAFRSGNVYAYSPASRDWRFMRDLSGPVNEADGGVLEMIQNGSVGWLRRAANRKVNARLYRLGDGQTWVSVDTGSDSVAQLVPLSDTLVLTRTQAGELLWFSNLAPVRMFQGRFPPRVPLAFAIGDREHDLRWAFSADGRYGIYNQRRRDWESTGTIPGEPNLQLAESGRLPSSDGGIWLTTSNGSHLFHRTALGGVRAQSLPGWFIHRVAVSSTRLYALARSASGVMSLFDVTSEPRLLVELPTATGAREVGLVGLDTRVRIRVPGQTFEYSAETGFRKVGWLDGLWGTAGVLLAFAGVFAWVAAGRLLARLGPREHAGASPLGPAIGLALVAALAALAGWRDFGNGDYPRLRVAWPPAGVALETETGARVPMLGQQGRFATDDVQHIVREEDLVSVQVRAGVWSFAVPDEAPRDFGDLDATLLAGATAPPPSPTYPAPLFTDGPWQWREDGTGRVAVYLRSGDGRARMFLNGKWADEVVRGITIPQAGTQAFVDTAGGVFECARDGCDGFGGQPPLTPSEADRVRFARPARGRLPGRLVPSDTGERGTRFAHDAVDDFVTGGADADALWVRGGDGVQHYTLGQAGILSLVADSATARALASPPSTEVRYASMRWSQQNETFTGVYDDGSRTAPVRIIDGRLVHDTVTDIGLANGHLLLATSAGLWEIDAKRNPRLRSLTAALPPAAGRRVYEHTGLTWRESRRAPAILSTGFRGQGAQPVGWRRLDDGSYKLAFDLAREVRLDDGVIVRTDGGTFRFTPERGLEPAISTRSRSAGRSAALFDLQQLEWHWEAPAGSQATAVVRLQQSGAVQTLADGTFPWDVVTQVRAGAHLEISTPAGGFRLRSGRVEFTGLAGAVRGTVPENIGARTAGLACDPAWGAAVSAQRDESATWLLCSRRLARSRTSLITRAESRP